MRVTISTAHISDPTLRNIAARSGNRSSIQPKSPQGIAAVTSAMTRRSEQVVGYSGDMD